MIEKIKTFPPNEIAGCVGGLVDMEALYCFKKFFKDTIGSLNIECREKKTYLNPQHKRNYIFNTSIQNIDKSHSILIDSLGGLIEQKLMEEEDKWQLFQSKFVNCLTKNKILKKIVSHSRKHGTGIHQVHVNVYSQADVLSAL